MLAAKLITLANTERKGKETAYTWTGDDSLEKFLSENTAFTL